jgi:ubiquinone/menaquinone biosynthesis methyltransferase
METPQIDEANTDTMTKSLFTLNMHDYIHCPEGKLLFNRKMFGHIASRYNFITRALSFGRDTSWKNWLIKQLPDFNKNGDILHFSPAQKGLKASKGEKAECPHFLDIACGTGDLTFRLAAKYPQGQIVGIDITEQMLNLARSRNTFDNITFAVGDMCRLDFPDNSFDIITAGYALRNAPDLELALKEIRRIMKPGAVAAILDFSKSPNRLFQKTQDFLLRFWGGFWGILLHRNPQLYTYIAASLRQFPDSAALKQLITQSGFVILKSRKHFLGFTETIVFQKT